MPSFFDFSPSIVIFEGTEISHDSAVLYGHLGSKTIKDSKEFGIMVSKSYNPEAGSGTKYPASIIDKKNVFSIKVENLMPETKCGFSPGEATGKGYATMV